MKLRFARLMLAALFCSCAVPSVRAAEDDSKPKQLKVRADDGLGIFCEVRGKGDVALLFLHGWCGTHEFWKNQVDVFADKYRVVTIDQAGHGQSGKDRRNWTIARLAEDVRAVVKELDLKHVILVGHSMGGPISVAAAKRLPGTVIAVVGVDTLHNAEYKMPEEVLKPFFEGLEKDFKGTMRTGMQGLLPKDVDTSVRDFIAGIAEKQNPVMAKALMYDLSRTDAKLLMSDVKVPVRCINAGTGFQYAIPTAVDINKKYADFDAVIMEGVGHFPMLERPNEFNDRLKQVLNELASKK